MTTDPTLAAPRQPHVITPNQAALESLAHTREAAVFMRQAADKLLEIAQLQQTPPELRTVVINPGNNGSYVTFDQSRFEAKSIGILNPNALTIFLGVGGVSATPTSRAITCPAQGFLVLPVALYNLELGADPAVLLTNTAVVFLFRFLSVQPIKAGKLL